MYDSMKDGRARFTAHTAFDDPGHPAARPAAREHRNPHPRLFRGSFVHGAETGCVGTRSGRRDDADYKVWAQLGVTHVCVDPLGNPHHWSLDDLNRHREHVEFFGLSLDMVQLPLPSRPIEESESPHILLGKDPERQREIDGICRLIERLAVAGIPAAKYNLCIIGIPRTEREAGRGGSRNAAFRWSRADQNVPPTQAGIVSDEEYWERINHFLGAWCRSRPPAKVRLACHPHDPYTPPGYRGVTRVLGTVEGLKRFVQMHESPYHGLNFCQGTVAEMLEDPARRSSMSSAGSASAARSSTCTSATSKGGRSISWRRSRTRATWTCPRSLDAYHEVGYPYMIMPDHVPQIDGRDPSGVAFAYCYGYIQALVDAFAPPHSCARPRNP